MILAAIFAKAQVTYQHYLNYTVHWSWELSGWNHFEFNHYYVHGDSVVNGKWYYDIWNNRYNDGNVSDQHEFLLREDSTNHYYKRYSGDTAEWLWYTFNLNNIGDTLSSEMIQGNTYYTLVTAIDTIYIGNEPRRRFYGDDPLDIIVEGIGNPGYINNFLHCYFKDGGVWTFNGDCLYQDVKSLSSFTFDVFPNPASQQLQVKLPDNFGSGQLCFFDLTGRVCKTEKISAGINVLDISFLPAGSYLLITQGTNTVLRKMITVER